MERFIQRFEEKIIGVLNGFDRLVFRGTLRSIAYPRGLGGFLWHKQVKLKDFGKYVYEVCEKVRERSCEKAKQEDRPVVYLKSSKIDKAATAEGIAERDKVEKGLIAIISCLEPCIGYDVVRNHQQKKLELAMRLRKCLFLYHYLIHPKFGFMNARIQSWFPFNIQICINGREWLAEEMDRIGMKYERRENCFLWIENVEEAQRLMSQQLKLNWGKTLDKIAVMMNPMHDEIFAGFPLKYYWSTFESEWATDLMFNDRVELERIYPSLILHGISTYQSKDVMRFLGKRYPSNTDREIRSSFKNRRIEGIRIKHWAGKNSVKLYDKATVLRVETTINDPQAFRAFRKKENDPKSKKRWRPVRKGIADLQRVATISQASNQRYLDCLSAADTSIVYGKLIEKICLPTKWKKQRVRALYPTAPQDLSLFRAVSHGEFVVNGFSNGDLRQILFPDCDSEKRRYSSKVTRLIRMLRAHHLIRKLPSRNRYLLTERGMQIIAAALTAHRISLFKLNEAVA
jgi:hypothetical protein